MYDFLKKMNFVRLSTTEGETKAANMIADEIRAIGGEPTIETFKAPHYEIKTSKLEVLTPFKKEYEVTGYGFSGNAAKDGIEAELVYVDAFDEINLRRVKGKIVLFSGGGSMSTSILTLICFCVVKPILNTSDDSLRNALSTDDGRPLCFNWISTSFPARANSSFIAGKYDSKSNDGSGLRREKSMSSENRSIP